MTSAELSQMVKTPLPQDVNSGLTSPSSAFMIGMLGKPGRLTHDCSEVLNLHLKSVIDTEEIGPFRATGHRTALLSLRRVFDEVKRKRPDLYEHVRSAGMLCCRAIRGSRTNYSNHSWGTAIDLYFGKEVDPMGDRECQRGLLELYPFFHARRWFWGGGFLKREDAMHFEASVELIQAWRKTGLL